MILSCALTCLFRQRVFPRHTGSLKLTVWGVSLRVHFTTSRLQTSGSDILSNEAQKPLHDAEKFLFCYTLQKKSNFNNKEKSPKFVDH